MSEASLRWREMVTGRMGSFELLKLGKYNQCQFGPSAMSAQVKRPIAREPWLRSGKGTRLFALGRACAFVIGSGAKANRALAPASRTSHGAP